MNAAGRPHVVAVATHPIQYHAPWFRALAKRPEFSFEVLFVTVPDAAQQGAGFGVPFQWDLPLRDGYDSSQIEGVAGSRAIGQFWATRLKSPGKVLNHHRPDVLILTGWQALPLLQLLSAARHRRIPVVVRGESSGLKARPALVRLLHRHLLRRYDAFLAIGKVNRRFYESNGVAPERIFDARYFVDNQRFATQADLLADRRQKLRDAWHIPHDAVCFCYAGKLEPKKRLPDLLEAVRRVVAGQPGLRIHLLVAGTGDLMDDARAFCGEHRLPVTFTGFLNQTEIAQAYVAADCLVLPSDYGETWGLVVNEAMACGRPAVVSDRVGCGPDLVEPGVTGEVFPFGDAGALAETLWPLVADPRRLGIMGQVARMRVMGEYSVEQAVEGTVAAVDYLLSGSR